ncbi:MAG: response regulator, partial [Proteobacteria bacterium]|nr:response regulator [Pseudomonadota bacterium]
ILVKKSVFTKKDAEIYPGMEPGAHVNIIFSDTGAGIPPEIMDRIFDPYFTTKPVGKGSGMGLAVVAGILKAHKGGIQVDSEPGKGSRFSIFLPATSLSPLPKVHESEQLASGTESILLVDDDPAITRIIEKILQQLGYKSLIFNDPLEALETIRSDPDSFDLVITDMVMPQMTGGDLARQIRAIRKALPIIICTGHNDLIDDQLARKTGIAGLILKPFVIQEISSTIRKALDENKTTLPH